MINSSEERLNNLSPLKKALFKIEKYKAELANLKSGKNTEEIAVIGMALDFPNAKNTDQFWKNLIHKKDAVTSFPNSRKNQLEPYYKSKGKAVENMAFQEGAYLDHIDQFDYEFFKFPAPLAATMHPLQRMYLHTSWRALEDAGALHPDRRRPRPRSSSRSRWRPRSKPRSSSPRWAARRQTGTPATGTMTKQREPWAPTRSPGSRNRTEFQTTLITLQSPIHRWFRGFRLAANSTTRHAGSSPETTTEAPKPTSPFLRSRWEVAARRRGDAGGRTRGWPGSGGRCGGPD